ncbi:MAG: NAD(P)/FAD-dependent oxidoreductase [Verrucomicrobiota bacterium]|nr:NAD(P)/FAD-dependent oxidoreductase [Verrucomicrobiota bacterium]
MTQPSYSSVLEPMAQHEAAPADSLENDWDAIIVGGGIAGLSAAIYLGRALRKSLIVDAGESLAIWEPHVQNYLGFPEGIAGPELLKLGREQATRYGIKFLKEEVHSISGSVGHFSVQGLHCSLNAKRVLLSTGLYHLPPQIPAVDECLGQSFFFCKDCDGWRVKDRKVLIVGRNNDAVEYALGMLLYSPCIMLATDGQPPKWDTQHAEWIHEYEIPVYSEKICDVEHVRGTLEIIRFSDGAEAKVDYLFTTRGDIFHNSLARQLNVELDEEGQIIVDAKQRTNIPGVYAAGCVTQANCQMIIAAGDGAAAGQAINRDLFDESLREHTLKRLREKQVAQGTATPELIRPR